LAPRLSDAGTGGALTLPTLQMSQGKAATKIHVTIFHVSEGSTKNHTKLRGAPETASLHRQE